MEKYQKEEEEDRKRNTEDRLNDLFAYRLSPFQYVLLPKLSSIRVEKNEMVEKKKNLYLIEYRLLE